MEYLKEASGQAAEAMKSWDYGVPVEEADLETAENVAKIFRMAPRGTENDKAAFLLNHFSSIKGHAVNEIQGLGVFAGICANVCEDNGVDLGEYKEGTINEYVEKTPLMFSNSVAHDSAIDIDGGAVGDVPQKQLSHSTMTAE